MIGYEVQGNYGQGWESVSAYDNKPDALRGLDEYRQNMPEYPHRVRRYHD